MFRRSGEDEEELKVAVVNTEGGRFLPGGGVEEGEDHEECLKREFQEETGFDVEIGRFVGKASEVGLTPRSRIHVELQGNFYLATVGAYIGGQVEMDHIVEWLPVDEALVRLKLGYQIYALSEGLKLFRTLERTD